MYLKKMEDGHVQRQDEMEDGGKEKKGGPAYQLGWERVKVRLQEQRLS